MIVRSDTLASRTLSRLGRYAFTPEREIAAGDFGLSAREAQTLMMIVEEKPLRVIAEQMDVSQHTVDTFKRRVFEKLGVSTLAGAAAVAAAHMAGMTLSPLKSAA